MMSDEPRDSISIDNQQFKYDSQVAHSTSSYNSNKKFVEACESRLKLFRSHHNKK